MTLPDGFQLPNYIKVINMGAFADVRNSINFALPATIEIINMEAFMGSTIKEGFG